MAAAVTEYINAYFKGGQHNRSAWRHSSRKGSLAGESVCCDAVGVFPPDAW